MFADKCIRHARRANRFALSAHRRGGASIADVPGVANVGSAAIDRATSRPEQRHDASAAREPTHGVDSEDMAEVFRETVAVLEREDVPYAVIGGIASTGYGRSRWTHDIDILVKPEDA